MSLASSMGDPAVGQLQDVLVYPVDYDDVVDDGTADELDELFRDDHPLRIVDGETRRLAAERLGWATLDATIVPEPPEETVVAQLDANTERLAMSEFETVRALYEFYEETDHTVEGVARKVGYSRSHLSNMFGLFEAPEWLLEAWRHPDHPLETSHARAVNAMLSSNSIDRYQEAGNLDDRAAWERAVDDARLMVDVQAEHELQVGEFRTRCQRCQKETFDELKDQRSVDDKRADGQTSTAEQTAQGYQDNTPDPEPCLVCGQDADRKIAVDVCREDYGMLSEMKATDEVLMANADAQATPAGLPDDNDGVDMTAAEALSKAANVSTDEAQAVIEEVRQQAAQSPPEATHD